MPTAPKSLSLDVLQRYHRPLILFGGGMRSATNAISGISLDKPVKPRGGPVAAPILTCMRTFVPARR